MLHSLYLADYSLYIVIHFGFADNSPSIVIFTDSIPVIAYLLLHLFTSSWLFSIGSFFQRNCNNFHWHHLPQKENNLFIVFHSECLFNSVNKKQRKKKKSNEEKVYFMQKGKQNSISTFDKNPQSLKTSPKPFQNWKYPPSKEKLFCTSTKSISVKKAKSFADDTSLFLRTLWY